MHHQKHYEHSEENDEHSYEQWLFHIFPSIAYGAGPVVVYPGNMITFTEWNTLELRAGTVMNAERISGSNKLVKLMVNLSEPDLPAGRQIVAGIGAQYEPEALIGRQIVVVANLEPKQLMGTESNGMLLAAHDEAGNAVLLVPERAVPPGSRIS